MAHRLPKSRPSAPSEPACPLRLAQEERAGAPQDYLDALPIPAAVLSIGGEGGGEVQRANDHFRALAGWDERLCGNGIASIDLLRTGEVADIVRQFVASGKIIDQVDAPGPPAFRIRLAQLGAKADGTATCLLSLIERSDGQALGKGDAVDPLTGLAGAPAFARLRADMLDQAGSGGPAYAHLVVEMIPPTAGDAAGMVKDELVLGFAGRLRTALRAGDVLARTADARFEMLARITDGIGEADRLADRIRSKLAAPFRLSHAKVAVGCAIVCLPLAATERPPQGDRPPLGQVPA